MLFLLLAFCGLQMLRELLPWFYLVVIPKVVQSRSQEVSRNPSKDQSVHRIRGEFFALGIFKIVGTKSNIL